MESVFKIPFPNLTTAWGGSRNFQGGGLQPFPLNYWRKFAKTGIQRFPHNLICTLYCIPICTGTCNNFRKKKHFEKNSVQCHKMIDKSAKGG